MMAILLLRHSLVTLTHGTKAKQQMRVLKFPFQSSQLLILQPIPSIMSREELIQCLFSILPLDAVTPLNSLLGTTSLPPIRSLTSLQSPSMESMFALPMEPILMESSTCRPQCLGPSHYTRSITTMDLR